VCEDLGSCVAASACLHGEQSVREIKQEIHNVRHTNYSKQAMSRTSVIQVLHLIPLIAGFILPLWHWQCKLSRDHTNE